MVGEGDPVGIGSGALVLEQPSTGIDRILDIAARVADLEDVVMGHTGSCADGSGLDAMSFYVNPAGEVTGFAGYGSPVDGGFADDPCAAVV